jgi:hypothetical protein
VLSCASFGAGRAFVAIPSEARAVLILPQPREGGAIDPSLSYEVHDDAKC